MAEPAVVQDQQLGAERLRLPGQTEDRGLVEIEVGGLLFLTKQVIKQCCFS